MNRAAVLLLIGCSTSAPKRPPRPDARPPGPSFKQDVEPVLAKTCAGTKKCHGDDPVDDVALDLRADAAFSQLVNKPAEMRKGAMRVGPGDPSRSFLVDKLRNQLTGHEGKGMPLDPDTGVTADPDPLPPGFIDDTLIPWIQAGAWND
jgi:hypothetical protein